MNHSIHPKVKVCVVCDENFEPRATDRATAKTCSRDCFRELARRNRAAQRNTNQVITPELRTEIQRRAAAGEKQMDIAADLGLARSTVSRAARAVTA